MEVKRYFVAREITILVMYLLSVLDNRLIVYFWAKQRSGTRTRSFYVIGVVGSLKESPLVFVAVLKIHTWAACRGWCTPLPSAPLHSALCTLHSALCTPTPAVEQKSIRNSINMSCPRSPIACFDALPTYFASWNHFYVYVLCVPSWSIDEEHNCQTRIFC